MVNPLPDFNLKENFPVASVIDAAQRNNALQQQSLQYGQQAFVQGMQAIGSVGQSLVDRRIRMAQAMAAANLIAQTDEGKNLLGENTVATVGGRPVTKNQTAQGTDPQGNILQTPVSNQSPVTQETMAMALEGVAPKDLLNHLLPKYVDQRTLEVDANGNIVKTTTNKAPKGSTTTVIKTPSIVGNSKDERARQMAAAKVKEKALTDLNDLAGGLQQIKSLFAKKEALTNQGKAGDPLRGGLAQMGAFLTKGKMGTADVKAFQDLRSGMIAKLKKVTGDSGVLTEQDAERLIGLLSSITEDIGASRTKLAEIESIFAGAEARYRAKADTLISEIQSGATIGPVGDVPTGGATPAPTSSGTPKQEKGSDLVHLSTQELLDLRNKMTAHRKKNEPKS